MLKTTEIKYKCKQGSESTVLPQAIVAAFWKRMTFWLNFEGCSIGRMMRHIHSTHNCNCLGSEPHYVLQYSMLQIISKKCSSCLSKPSIYLDSTIKMIIRKKGRVKEGMQTAHARSRRWLKELECNVLHARALGFITTSPFPSIARCVWFPNQNKYDHVPCPWLKILQWLV